MDTITICKVKEPPEMLRCCTISNKRHKKILQARKRKANILFNIRMKIMKAVISFPKSKMIKMNKF